MNNIDVVRANLFKSNQKNDELKEEIRTTNHELYWSIFECIDHRVKLKLPMLHKKVLAMESQNYPFPPDHDPVFNMRFLAELIGIKWPLSYDIANYNQRKLLIKKLRRIQAKLDEIEENDLEAFTVL